LMGGEYWEKGQSRPETMWVPNTRVQKPITRKRKSGKGRKITKKQRWLGREKVFNNLVEACVYTGRKKKNNEGGVLGKGGAKPKTRVN